MQKRSVWQYVPALLLIGVVILAGMTTNVDAITSTSPNYQVTETQFGSGSTLNSCSGQYCAQASIGDTAVGQSGSGDKTAQFGAVTEGDPLLEVIIEPGDSNLGVLSTETTASKTTIIKIRNYLSSGYIVQLVGSAPTYNGHALATPSSPTSSSPGTEQFAINLAANTSPQVGTLPLQVPSTQTSFGVAAPNYRTANQFMYASEDTIARSESESGETDYTVSMIVNISNATPAGHYTGDFSAIVIPIY